MNLMDRLLITSLGTIVVIMLEKIYFILFAEYSRINDINDFYLTLEFIDSVCNILLVLSIFCIIASLLALDELVNNVKNKE